MFSGLENLNLTLSGWKLCWTSLSFMFSLLFFQGKRSEGRVERTKKKREWRNCSKILPFPGQEFHNSLLRAAFISEFQLLREGSRNIKRCLSVICPTYRIVGRARKMTDSFMVPHVLYSGAWWIQGKSGTHTLEAFSQSLDRLQAKLCALCPLRLFHWEKVLMYHLVSYNACSLSTAI